MELRNKPVGETLAEELRQAILERRLEAGTEVRQEDLAAQYNISRIPVREALQRLERDGLVTIQSNRRAVVVEITDRDLDDHYEVRALIEGELAGRAAEKMEESRELYEAFLEGERLVNSGDAVGFVRANELFHKRVWNVSGSSRLYTLASQLWTGIPPYRPLLFPTQMHSSIDEHRSILDAIVAGRKEAARHLMRRHIIHARNDLLRARSPKAQINFDIKIMEESFDE